MCQGRKRACVAVPHVHFVKPFVQDDCAGNVGEKDAAVKTQKLSSESSQRFSCCTKLTTNLVPHLLLRTTCSARNARNNRMFPAPTQLLIQGQW